MSTGELADSLHDHMTSTFELPRLEDGRPYLATGDDSQAEWALRKLGKAREAALRVDRLADDQIAQVEAWRDQQQAALAPDIGFFTGLLEDWHRRTLSDDAKAKSVTLPSGTLKSRAGQARIVVTNDNDVLEWLTGDELDDLMPEKPAERRPALSAWKKAVKAERFAVVDGRLVDAETGEVVPGVTVEQGTRTFTQEVR